MLHLPSIHLHKKRRQRGHGCGMGMRENGNFISPQPYELAIFALSSNPISA
jgi:hypothetical protein